jgi:glucose/arabinose dehydrogenase
MNTHSTNFSPSRLHRTHWLPWLLLWLAAACSPASPAATSAPTTAAPAMTIAATGVATLIPAATNSIAAAASAAPAQTLVAPTATRPAPTATAKPATPSAAGFNPAVTTIRLDKVLGGLASPTDAKPANDGSGRLFVVEKAGTIHIVRNGALLPTPFLSITSLVRSNESERGLLGVAFHPKYKTNGQFYVYYTESTGDLIIARYKVSSNPDVADPNSGQELLRIAHRNAANHNGGNLVFGPDGYLYIGTGDGGGAGDTYGNSQNPNALLAKLLRIDVDSGSPYGIPKDNPFVNKAGFRPEVWAWGLRNPWRFSFDRATGDLFIADVGQDIYEEVDFQQASSKGGENYGWNKMEATHCFPPGAQCSAAGFVLPVAEYAHSGGDCSITGGYIYRGTAQPALNGAYFFADYCTGHFWSLVRGADGKWLMTDQLKAGFTISSFAQDEAGEIYVLNIGDGEMYHVVGVTR